MTSLDNNTETPKKKLKPKEKPHYVNNAQFSEAVVAYVTRLNTAQANDDPDPIVPDYIAQCFLKISEGLSHKSNFVRYTYREEMVMDAVENCLRAVKNYDIEAATRTGKPNAFAYFTQISWYAFLRRIQKEKKQQDIKLKYLSESGFEEYMTEGEGNNTVNAFVDTLKGRIDKVKAVDIQVKEFGEEEKSRRRRAVRLDSDLSDFIVD
jgi:hypothetical protein